MAAARRKVAQPIGTLREGTKVFGLIGVSRVWANVIDTGKCDNSNFRIKIPLHTVDYL